WSRYTIKNDGLKYQHDQAFGDFDGDGKIELVWWGRSSTASKLYLAEIPVNPKGIWPYLTISDTTVNISTGKFPREGMKVVNIDLDNKIDILGGGGWFKHTSANNYTFESIESARSGVEGRVDAGQLIPWGRPEVVFCAGDFEGFLAWYEWNGSQWIKHILKNDVDHGHSVQIADVNGDGHLDIFFAEMRLNDGNEDAKMLVFYGNGRGNFVETPLPEGFGNHESRVADLDGDGDMDILGKPYNWEAPRVDVWLQQRETLGFSNWQSFIVDNNREQYADGKNWYNYFGIYAGDISGDGQEDIVSGKYVYTNPGTITDNWEMHALPVKADGALILNIDADNNADVIAFALPYIYWFEVNAQGEWIEIRKMDYSTRNIETQHRNPQGWRLADLTGNGREEIIFEAGNENDSSLGIYALEIPSSPAADNWPLTRLTTVGSDGVGVGDIDNDGDLDLTSGPKNVKWYENPGSLGNWTGHNVGDTEIFADRFAIADIDGDGKNDIIVSEETYPEADDYPTSCYWFKNPDWQRNYVANGYHGLQSMEPVDMDNDGDIDVVLGEHKMAKRMFVFENNGSGGFTEHQIGAGYESHGLFVSDIDHDGDKDIAHIGWADYQSLYLWINGNAGSPPPPDSGIVYKEFTFNNDKNNWRVTDPGVDLVKFPEAAAFLPNPKLQIALDDLQEADNAELIMDFWGGHEGTIDKKLRFNNNNWIVIPELHNIGPCPSPGNKYIQQVNHKISIPLNNLITGQNVFEGTSGPNGWDWGQWGWYGIVLRIYYDSDKPHTTGQITYPVSNSTISANPTILISVSGNADRVDVLAYYDGYDTDGDGVYADWQSNYHRQSWEEQIGISNHVGTDTSSPFQITWDTTRVPDQNPGTIKLKARIRNTGGYWYETAPVENITLSRQQSVKLYKPYNVQQKFWVRAGEVKASNVNIPSLSDAATAIMHIKTWNGNDESNDFYTKINNWTTPKYGKNHFYHYDQITVPISELKTGENTITFSSTTLHHGIEIMWPGPAIQIVYNYTAPPPTPTPTSTPTPPPGDNLIINPGFESGTNSWSFYGGGEADFSVAAPGSGGSGNSAKVSLSQSGDNIQLYQYGIALNPNTGYRLSFDAYSNTGNDLSVSLHKHEAPYTNYGLKQVFELNTLWKSCSVEFDTTGFSEPVSDARLRFWFVTYGQAGDEYRIDNVVLTLIQDNIPGDVTADGRINIQDIQACVNHILGVQEWGKSADVNGDGSVNILDVQEIVKLCLAL
ncbi:VCBS repeat-containing protein, partial [bacterium]|nr:VCBS repeat-containing protein [bacterium]